MTTIEVNSDIVHFNKKFGLITEKQIIITEGSQHNKINFESINRVNLIKKRVFYSNMTLFLISICVFGYTFFFIQSNKKDMFYSMILIGILFLVYSIIHKFYQYKLVIKFKDNSIHEIQTTQLHRKSIKEFYSSIIKRIPKKTKEY
ncbi:hypothetical protein [Flavobacterium sp.]|uniref:hypothetical protein n=1 Tax=Flavobacterium sp. TaxID=239 RepID=UPI00375185BF